MLVSVSSMCARSARVVGLGEAQVLPGLRRAGPELGDGLREGAREIVFGHGDLAALREQGGMPFEVALLQQRDLLPQADQPLVER